MPNYSSAPCPNCGTPLRIKPEYYGHEVVCKFCQKPFVLEAPSEDREGAPNGELEGGTKEPTDLEKLWESEAARAEQPKPVRRAAPKPALAKKTIDLEDSSMLIPVHRDDAGTSVAERPSPEAEKPRSAAMPAPPSVTDERKSQRELQIRALRQEIERREKRVAQVETQVRVERGEIERLRTELERVERG